MRLSANRGFTVGEFQAAGDRGGLTPSFGVFARTGTVLLLVFSFVGPSAQAYAQVDRGIAAKKLIILDRTPTGGASKTSFRAKDDGLAIGAGEDAGRVDARFEIRYPDSAAFGAFVIPGGEYDGTAGWTPSRDRVRYTNKNAPEGATQVKTLGITTKKTLKFSAAGTGDEALDLVSAGAPAGPVTAVMTLNNDGETLHYCSEFESCIHREYGGGSAAKLICTKGRAADCPDDLRFRRLTKARRPTRLFVIPLDAMNAEEKVMIATLQGNVARLSEEQIWIDQQAGGYPIWLNDLATNYGVTLTSVTDPWTLVEHFSGHVNRYVLYSPGNGSVNTATSMAGVEQAVAVGTSIEASAIAHGLSLAMDVRSLNEDWVLANHADRFNPYVAVEQRENFEHQLRDYAVLSRAMTFYDGNSAFRDQMIDFLEPDGMTYGWGDASIGEDVFVGASSDRGVFTLAADHAHNLAPLSGIPTRQQAQRTHGTPSAEPGKHYTTFLLTDGDNLQWTLGTFATGTTWYGSPLRGSFDMGYALPPAMADLAPSVIQWYYDTAATSPGRDFFVVGPSGGGYLYPSRYPFDQLQTHVERLCGWMGLADLNIVQILDQQAFEADDRWDLYTGCEEIDGLIYLEYADYSGEAGRLRWSNNEPVLAARAKIWNGLPGSDIATVTDVLNNAVRDATSSTGYSVVSLAAWSNSLADVQTVIDGLDPEVEVVTPGDLVSLITQNVPHDAVVRFDFTGADYQTASMTLTGNALWVTDNDALFQPLPQRLRLTSNNGGQNGAAWLNQPVDPAQSWSTSYRFQISYPVAGGADGIGFHVQSDGEAITPGFSGPFSNPSMSVVVDTWDNGEGTSESLRVMVNGVQVLFNDLTDFNADPTPGSLPHVFRMELEYAGNAKLLRVRLIDEGGTAALENSVAVDLSAFGASWMGFSASTGGAAENHDMRTWYLAAALP